MKEKNGTIVFIAQIPNKKGAISFDGEDRAGGELRLAFSGTEVAPAVRMLTMRGKALVVTIAAQQAQLPLGSAPADGERSESLFPETPATVSPSGPTTAEDGPHSLVTVGGDMIRFPVAGTAIADPLPAHVHRYRDGVCLDCGEAAGGPDDSRLPSSPRARRVRRGLIPRGKKAKR